MPMHNGWLPREGLTGDPIGRFIKKTALNPSFTLPLILLAYYTKKGQDLSILHPKAFRRLKTLFYLGLARWASSYLSRRALNNGVSDKYDWNKEIVVVTGGAGGIGGHVVKLLAERNIKVAVLDVIPMTFEIPNNVHYFKCDITSPATIAAVAKEIRSNIGTPTILISNAGVARGKTVLDSTEKDIRFTFDVNALAHYWLVQEFLPAMIEKNHGMVVTVASLAAYAGVPGMVDYASTKAAALSFHEGLAAELKTRYNSPKVRTVVVNQGYTKTPLFAGFNSGSPFLMPPLEVETVAEGIVRQVLSGESGQVVLPGFGSTLIWLRGMPHWYQVGIRNRSKNAMTKWHGRQVVKDVEKYYEDKEKDAESA